MIKSAKSERNGNSFVSGALALTISVIIVKIIGFIYKLPLSYILGDEGMGYFNSAYSVFSFFYMLCSGGVPRAVSIIITEATVKENEKNAEKILSISLKVFVLVGLLFTAALMIFSRYFAKLIGNSLSSFSLFAIAPALTFVAGAGVLRGYLSGKGRMGEIAIGEVLDGCIKFIFGLTLAIFAYKRNLPVQLISAYTILGVTLGAFIGALFLFVCSKSKKTNEKTEQKQECLFNNCRIIGRILKISIPITLSSAIMGITNIIDLSMIMKRLVNSGYTEERAISLYGNFTTLAVPLLNVVVALITPICTAAMPHITKKIALGEKSEYYEFCKQIILFVGIIVIPIGAAYLLFSEEILTLLFNDTSAKIAYPLLSLISPAVVFLPLLTATNTILEASMHPRLPLIAMSIGSVVKLASAYVLIGNIGICGAPISTALGYVVSLLISVLFMLLKLEIKISVFGILAVPVFAAGISVFLGHFIYNYFLGGRFAILNLVLIFLFSFALYIAIIGVFMRKKIKMLCDYVKIAKKNDCSL